MEDHRDTRTEQSGRAPTASSYESVAVARLARVAKARPTAQAVLMKPMMPNDSGRSLEDERRATGDGERSGGRKLMTGQSEHPDP